MTLPPGFTLRPTTLDDIDAVVALVRASDDAGLTTGPTSRASLLRHWQDPHRLEGDRDTLVIAPDGRIAGYLELFQFEPFTVFEFEAYVHPGYAATPAFMMMLELAESRARESMSRAPKGESIYLDGEVGGAASQLHRAFEAAGFAHVRDFLTMLADMDAPPPPAIWPDGVGVRGFVTGQDEREVWEVSEAAWVDHWRYAPMPFEEFVYLRITAQANFDPSLWFMATEGDTIVGALLGLPDRAGLPDTGWVSLLAVRREFRGQGIGLALLLEAFGEFYRRGYHKVGLVVDGDSETGANRLYERAGMREIRRSLTFEKVLRPAHEEDTAGHNHP